MKIEKTVGMFQIAEGNFNTPAPVITGFDVFQNKSMRQISNHIFICVFCDLDFYNPKLHEIKVFVIEKLLEVGNIFVRIHVVVDVGLVFHDAGIFVGEKTLNRDIEFLLVYNLEDFPFAEYPASDEQIHFLFIGRVMKEKGIDELFTAMQQLYLQHQNIVLDVVGRCEEDYESKLRELQDEGLIHCYGFQKDVKPFISQAHVFVLPSYHEGMANTLLESAAMGRPLITSNIHGCMEAVVNGKTGFLCEVKNVQSLEEQMEKFITLSYEAKKQMGKFSSQYVSGIFDKIKVVQQTIDILYG